MKLGIMGAMPEEIARFEREMTLERTERHGMREYHIGRLCGHEVVVVFSRIGKVAAASTATTLLERFGVEGIIFTGVAGGVDPQLNVGDVVVADALVQHDMDASRLPWFARFEIPLLGVTRFPVETFWVDAARMAAETYLKTRFPAEVAAADCRALGIECPKAVVGMVASGDQFLADAEAGEALRTVLPDLSCVEMEGAAVAQVAHEHGIPCVVIRSISDKANHDAATDFSAYVSKIATPMSCGIVVNLLQALRRPLIP